MMDFDDVSPAHIEIAYDMIEVGANELRRYDPAKHDPMEVVARIYIAMELMRLLLEDGEMPPQDKKMLN